MLTRLAGFLGRWLVKTPVKIVLGLVAAYFLFAWFGFQPLVQWAAPKFIADKSQHRLSIAEARFDPLALSVSIKGLKLAEPDGKSLLAFDELFVDFEAASLFKWAYTFDVLRLSAPQARVELRADGSLNWSALIQALKSDDEDEPDKPLPRLLVRRIVLERGQVAVADRKVDFETRLDALALNLSDLSTLPDDKGAYTLATTTELGARVRWKGDFGLNPVLASGELAIDQLELAKFWPYLQGKLHMAPPQGVAALSLAYRAGYADKRVSLALDQLGMNLIGLALRGVHDAAPAIRLDRLALSNGRFDLDKRQLDIGEIALNGGHVHLNRSAAGRIDLQDWLPAPAASPATTPANTQDKPPAAAPKSTAASARSDPAQAAWRIALNRFTLDGLALRLVDQGFVTPLALEVGNIRLGFGVNAAIGAGPAQVKVGDLGLDLSGVRVLSGKETQPLVVLGGASLEGGRVDLAARTFAASRVALSNGRADVRRDRQGRIPLLLASQRIPGPATAPRLRTEAADAALDWQYAVDQVGLSGFQFDVRDETVSPAAGLSVTDLSASAAKVSQNLRAPLPVKLGFRVKEGGQFQAEGRVVPAAASADLKLALRDLSLKPAQPYLAQTANLELASGRASLQGRLKVAGDLDFSGGFAVDDLRVNESGAGGERFLAWKRLSSDSVSVTPKALAIEELRLDSLGAKLVIYPDKTVNLKRILKDSPAPAATPEPGKPATPAPAAPAAKAPATPVRMTIDRIRVENGELDFADLSLALPFGTRIHGFKGAFNGISTQPGDLAELELDGQVDDYGLARAVGQINLFDPTGFMDIKTVFRNVEMTNLTPYTATFVGRKIQSGKLSLDLEYKIKARQLLGENQIVMDKLTLGERVQSASAKDLPLDLAIAILQDSDGKIDLGLPVSGSLDDPQFSYGRIIWKAIGNILTKIVTAPFRALGALFGGGGEKLEKVAFEAGEAGLTPPEKEKFKQISQILNKRPGLALTVHGAWSAEIDRPAVKERQLRRAVAETMGMKLAAEEDPGPVSTANAKARTALETLYAARFGEDAWKTLNARWLQANPEKKQQSTAGKMVSRLKSLFKPEEPLSAEDQTLLKDADLHAMLYQRLLARESVSDAALAQLAQRRGQAILEGLAAAGGPAERVRLGDSAAFEGEGREVPARLELGVARR